MKKLALFILSLSLLLGACQQGPGTEATAPTPPTAATPAPPAVTAPTGDLTAFAGEYTGNFSERKKAEQKARGLTETETDLTLNPDGTFIMTVSLTGTDPVTNQEQSEEVSVRGTFAVEGATMRLSAQTLTAGDGTETPATDQRPLVLTIEENGQRLTVSPDQAQDAISPDFFQRS